MSAVGLFDLLGIASIQEAAALWPTDYLPLDVAEIEPMVAELEGALTFRNVRPSASPDGVGLTADLLVGALLPSRPIIFATLPKLEFRLIATSGPPARLYVRQSATGVECIIEALPIEIALPDGLLTPFDPVAGDLDTGLFVSGQADSYAIALKATAPSTIRAHVKLRVSEAFDFVLEFATPISVGPCRFSGIPCAAVHDLGFILTPEPSTAMDPRTEALEWLRHKLDGPPGSGFITARTIDLFSPGSRLFEATGRGNENRPAAQFVEPVLEDLVVSAVAAAPIPFPVHFTAGVRRSLGVDDNPNGAYQLGDKPVIVPIIRESGLNESDGLYLIVRQALVRSFANATSLDDPQVAFLDAALSNDPNALGFSATIALTDEWTVEGGIHIEPPFKLFTLFNVDVKAMGARAGLSFKRLFDQDSEATFADAAVLLGDLVLVLGPDPPASEGTSDGVPAKIKSKTDQPTTIVVNDFGWKLGDFQFGNFWQADKAELKAAGVLRLSIDQFGFVTEPDGARYFSFSGTWPVFGAPTTDYQTGSVSSTAFGMQFYRLRWKIRGPSDARPFLIDGLGLFLQFKTFSIIGSGMLSDRKEGDIRYREAALSIELKFTLGKPSSPWMLTIGGQFLHGRASGGADFTYLLAGAKISPIPLTGCVSLVNLRGLYANNMQPRLGPVDAGTAQPMRLFSWYKANFAGVEVPVTRNIAAVGWEPKEDAWAFAAGAGVKAGGSNAVTLDAFFLYIHSPAFRGFLAALEVYLGGKKPIAYGVVEVEGDHWSVLIGLAIGVENAVGRKIPFFNDAVGLTGTFYATNQPGTFAIGRLDDTSSWLALQIKGDLWIFKLRLFIGVCLELVDVPGGPRVLAFRVEFSGGTRRCWIGSIDFSLSLQLTVGVWRSESRVSGFIQLLEGSIKINVLFVFRFGASFKVEWAFLGPDPAFRRIGCEVKIRTPWWMPDKTFRWNRTIGEPHMEEMGTASPPMVEAAAHPLAAQQPVPLPVSKLSDDPQATFSLNQFEALGPPAIGETPAAIAIDSVVALHFKPAVDDRILWGQNTPPNASRQDSSKVSTTYALVELGIRRRPLHGTGSSTWTTLLDPALSRTDNLPTPPPDAHSPCAIRWDADFQREQTLDPRHLLLNSELPWRFVVANFQNDENLVRNMPGWPCCPVFESDDGEHVLDFRDQEVGARAPASQLFTHSLSPWRWLMTPPLIDLAAADLKAARLFLGAVAEGAFASVRFDHPAAFVALDVRWKAMHLPRTLVISAFRGLKLVAELKFRLGGDAPPIIEIEQPDGIDSLILRIEGRPVPPTAGVDSGVQIVSARYRTRDELLDAVLHQIRCDASDPATGGNGSRFAWLPDHEYEVRVVTRVGFAHTEAGELRTEVPQIALFRTKGPPGLNAVSRVGEELDPYVESTYPPAGLCLYRREPAMVAFNERFDIFQGLDRPPVASDPPERKQQVNWELTAEQAGAAGGGERISAPTADWILTHRGTGTTPPPSRPVVRPTKHLVRAALSTNPQQLRADVLIQSSPSCGMTAPPVRQSRVLSHPPAGTEGSTPRWPARSQVRVNLRLVDSPFVARNAFEADDATSFSTTGAAWQVADGLLGPSNPGPVQLARFGDADWDHLVAEVEIDSIGTRAGLAVAADAASMLLAWIDGSNLRLVRRTGATEQELGSAALSGEGPRLLSVTAFDDELEARVGTARVRAPRGDARAGRLALAAEGAAKFRALRVDGLDAYRFELQVSRYDDFAAHIASFAGTVTPLSPLAPATATAAELEAAGAPFAKWIAALALPLRAEPQRLEIGADPEGLLLVESPEPLGADVEVRLRQAGGDIAAAVIVDGDGRRLLIVPAAPLSGDVEIRFSVARDRYRAAMPDSDSAMSVSATLVVSL